MSIVNLQTSKKIMHRKFYKDYKIKKNYSRNFKKNKKITDKNWKM